jgi:hypothetical protein
VSLTEKRAFDVINGRWIVWGQIPDGLEIIGRYYGEKDLFKILAAFKGVMLGRIRSGISRMKGGFRNVTF